MQWDDQINSLVIRHLYFTPFQLFSSITYFPIIDLKMNPTLCTIVFFSLQATVLLAQSDSENSSELIKLYIYFDLNKHSHTIMWFSYDPGQVQSSTNECNGLFGRASNGRSGKIRRSTIEPNNPQKGTRFSHARMGKRKQQKGINVL